MFRCYTCIVFVLCFQNLFSTVCTIPSFIYVTNESAKGPVRFTDGHIEERRLGNQLLAYFKAQWIAEKFSLPYVHSSFPYDELIFAGHVHKRYEDIKYEFPNMICTSPTNILSIKSTQGNENQPIVFRIKYLSTLEKGMPRYDLHRWQEMRRNFHFIKKMRHLLSPVKTLANIIAPPREKKSVAVHVRKGGGYDMPLWSMQYFSKETLRKESRAKKLSEKERSFLRGHYQDWYRPLKSPPEQYYVDSLNTILQLYPNEFFFVYVFTDDPDPEAIVKRFRRHLNNHERIEFGYRSTGNAQDSNVIEDMISMMNFDMLVRTISSYSVYSHVLGNHELVVYPRHHCWIGRCLVYDEVCYEKALDIVEVKRNKMLIH